MVRHQGWNERAARGVARTDAVASGALFEYTGATALTVFGAITGTRYRFAHSGARLTIQARDAPAMASVPILRRC